MCNNDSNRGGVFGSRVVLWVMAGMAVLALWLSPGEAAGATTSVSTPAFRLRTAIDASIAVPTGETQEVAYSTRWDTPEAGSVHVTAKNMEGTTSNLMSATGRAEGTVAWTPSTAGYYVLTHATSTNRAATFLVGTLVDIVYNAEGGTPATQTQQHVCDVAYGSFPPAPTRTGYTFAGWWTATTGGTKVETTTIVTGAATLYARWTGNTYAVTLDRQGGSGGTASVTATYGSAMPKITVPTCTGYAFAGYWSSTNGGAQYYTASGTSAQAWSLTADSTLYAKWTPQSYAVTLDAQGGTGGTASVTATYGNALPNITIPTRPGYVFAGYWTAADGTGTQYYTANGTGVQNWDEATAMTLFAYWADPVFHVDAAAGNNSNDGFSWQTAKASIQAAIDEARDGARILVNDGVYGPISTVSGYWSDSDGEWHSVGKGLEIVSVNGAEKTIIDASGIDATRAAYLGLRDWKGDADGPQAILEGFTIRGGHPSDTVSPIGAGAYGGVLRRCIVTGNQGKAAGGGVAAAICEGCTIASNKTTWIGGGAYYCTLVDCIVEDNEAGESGGGACGGWLERCVVRRNTAGKYGGGHSGGDAVDCLFAGNVATLGGGAVNSDNLSRCTVVSNHTDGIGGGVLRTVLHSSIVWGNTAGQQDDNWNTSQGAYNDTAPLLSGRGNIAANPLFMDAASGDYRLSTESPCIDAGLGPTDISRKDLAGNQRWQGARMDMGAYETADSSVPTFTTVDLWVDAANGRDTADGTSREAPLATIQTAVEKASDGATIHVLPGTYEPFTADGRSLTIQGTDGAERTIVNGRGAAQCAWLGTDSESILEGLTLCNGYARYGGGVWGGTLRGCVVRDNSSELEGGGAFLARLDRCIIRDNSSAEGSGGGAFRCDLSDCLVYGNSAYSGGGVWCDGRFVVNCTVVGNTAKTTGGGIMSAGYVKNSIVWGNSAPDSPDLWGCDEWNVCSPVIDSDCGGSITNDPLFVNADAGDFRLRADSPCINAGANEFVLSDTDLAGNTRIYGSVVDMGAYELLAGLIVELKTPVTNDRRTCILRLGTAAGSRYEVQWTDDLRGKWTTIKSFTADKDGEIEIEAVPLEEGATGFFRLMMPE